MILMRVEIKHMLHTYLLLMVVLLFVAFVDESYGLLMLPIRYKQSHLPSILG